MRADHPYPESVAAIVRAAVEAVPGCTLEALNGFGDRASAVTHLTMVDVVVSGWSPSLHRLQANRMVAVAKPLPECRDEAEFAAAVIAEIASEELAMQSDRAAHAAALGIVAPIDLAGRDTLVGHLEMDRGLLELLQPGGRAATAAARRGLVRCIASMVHSAHTDYDSDFGFTPYVGDSYTTVSEGAMTPKAEAAPWDPPVRHVTIDVLVTTGQTSPDAVQEEGGCGGFGMCGTRYSPHVDGDEAAATTVADDHVEGMLACNDPAAPHYDGTTFSVPCELADTLGTAAIGRPLRDLAALPERVDQAIGHRVTASLKRTRTGWTGFILEPDRVLLRWW